MLATAHFHFGTYSMSLCYCLSYKLRDGMRNLISFVHACLFWKLLFFLSLTSHEDTTKAGKKKSKNCFNFFLLCVFFLFLFIYFISPYSIYQLVSIHWHSQMALYTCGYFVGEFQWMFCEFWNSFVCALTLRLRD